MHGGGQALLNRKLSFKATVSPSPSETSNRVRSKVTISPNTTGASAPSHCSARQASRHESSPSASCPKGVEKCATRRRACSWLADGLREAVLDRARVPFATLSFALAACAPTPPSEPSSIDAVRCSYQEHEAAACQQLARAALVEAGGQRVPLDVSRCSGDASSVDVTWLRHDTGVFVYRGHLTFSATSPRGPMTAQALAPDIREWPCVDDGCKRMRDLPINSSVVLPIVQPCPGVRREAPGEAVVPLTPASICSDGRSPAQGCAEQQEGTEEYAVEQRPPRAAPRSAVIELRGGTISIRRGREAPQLWPKEKSETLTATLAELWQAPLDLDASCRDGTWTRIHARRPGAWRILVRRCGGFPALDEALSADGAAPAPEPLAPRPNACAVDEAMRAFVGDGPTVACGTLATRASDAEYDALAKCIVAAIRAKKPFTALARVRGIDSTFALGYAGRTEGKAFQVREFRYDSSPSGRGNVDPTWESAVCNPLHEASRVCNDPRIPVQHEGMRGYCEAYREGPASYPGDPRRRAALQLGLFCASETQSEVCPDWNPEQQESQP